MIFPKCLIDLVGHTWKLGCNAFITLLSSLYCHAANKLHHSKAVKVGEMSWCGDGKTHFAVCTSNQQQPQDGLVVLVSPGCGHGCTGMGCSLLLEDVPGCKSSRPRAWSPFTALHANGECEECSCLPGKEHEVKTDISLFFMNNKITKQR